MSHIKKINKTLALATTVLLQACGSAGSGSTSGPAAVVNVKAPELIGTWETGCVVTSQSGSSTVTQASGSGGTGSISGGEAYQLTAVFNQDGHVDFSSETYATSNCNSNTLSGSGVYSAVYFIGEPGLANDGSPVTDYHYSDSISTTYSIFQVVNGTRLYLGDVSTSSTGNDGDSQATRLDGLGAGMVKR
ncbi:MAG: hypothetical protein KJN89_10345 [Gammaproteobacteria bacterium]|nr:hypothetical protein [Gammaproteobacteria bacterium]NNJ50766.1 hypothetical protein [Gammaproteobacteria bacterium]